METEKPSVVVNGSIKLPIGYRFHPTDEELVVHYLKRKVFGLPLPASVIPEFDVFQTDPWSLPGDLEEKRYFFGEKKGNKNENKCKRAAGSGYWKSVGKGRQIVASGSNQIVGIRRTLVFCEKKQSHKTTQWVMHEYRLVGSEIIQMAKKEMGDWVVYRVFQRKRKATKHRVSMPLNTNKTTPTVFEVISPSFMDFTVKLEGSDAGPPQPSSPCSSGITEISCNGLDQEEITSSFSSFSSYSSMMRKN